MVLKASMEDLTFLVIIQRFDQGSLIDSLASQMNTVKYLTHTGYVSCVTRISIIKHSELLLSTKR